MIDQERLTELRAKYGKRDGSTFYPEEKPFNFDEWVKTQRRPYWRIRKFAHHMRGAFWVIILGNSAPDAGCACPGACHVIGFCQLAISWPWVYRFSDWLDNTGHTTNE